MYVPHPEPPSHLLPHPIPSGSSQCTNPEHPVSCIKPGLAIRFTYYNIHVSNVILPSHPSRALSHRIQKTVLYICVSFADEVPFDQPLPQYIASSPNTWPLPLASEVIY